MAYITIRVSEEFKLSLQQRAGDKSLSDYIRQQLEAVLPNEESVAQSMQDEIIKRLVTQNQSVLPIHKETVLPDEPVIYQEVNYAKLKRFRQ